MTGTCVPIFCIRKKDNLVVSVNDGLNLELKSDHLLVRGAHTAPQSTHAESSLSPLRRKEIPLRRKEIPPPTDFTSPITNLLQRLILPISGFLGRHVFNLVLVTVTILEIQASSLRNQRSYAL